MSDELPISASAVPAYPGRLSLPALRAEDQVRFPEFQEPAAVGARTQHAVGQA
jgi:hypothetical protein